MGDDIGLGSVTDCRLCRFYGHKQHTQLHQAAPRQKSKQMHLVSMASPLNNITLMITIFIAKSLSKWIKEPQPQTCYLCNNRKLKRS